MPVKRQQASSDDGDIDSPYHSREAHITAAAAAAVTAAAAASATPPQPSNFSRKKPSSSTRTGQACDRCKVRKIRCDARPGGCSPCLQNNAECRTTDRITGRATSRGYTETIEQENDALKHAIAELQQQLRSLGVEPKVTSSYQPAALSSHMNWTARTGSDAAGWDTSQHQVSNGEQREYENNPATPSNKAHETNLFALPSSRTGVDPYSGSSAPRPSDLSLVKGTSLSVFGMEIDLADYLPPDDMLSPTSSSMFVSLTFNRMPRPETSLPATYEEMEVHVKWYLKSSNAWMPILHAPSFMELIDKYYHDRSFTPTTADLVTMHMVLAIWTYQIGTRNLDQGLQAQSHAHYHHCLGLIPELSTSQTISDLQALTLIAYHLRFFPRPGPAWLMSNWTRSLAIQSGLHRSANACGGHDKVRRSHLEIEMRKRIFWALLLINISVGGMLGRPMPLRCEDFDVEIPEPMNDNLPGEQPSCSFLGAIETMKLSRIQLETYTSLYAVQPCANYEETVKSLEAKLQKWHDQLPPFLTADNPSSEHMDKIFGHWLRSWELELQLLLHHPALCRSSSPEFIARNLKICGEASSDLIQNVGELKKYKSLDTTWMSATCYIAATFTLLFVKWQQRDQITSSDLNKLDADINLSTEILRTVGYLIGSGDRLLDAVRPIIESCLLNVKTHVNQKTASAAVAHAGMKLSSPKQTNTAQLKAETFKAETFSASANYTNSYHGSDNSLNGQVPNRGTSYVSNSDVPVTLAQTSYPPNVQNAYPQSASSSMAAYPYNSDNFEAQNYHVSDGDVTDQAHVSSHVQQPHEQFVFSNNPYQASLNFGGPSAWRQWTEAMKVNHLEPQEYIPASALMQLGGREPNPSDTNQNLSILPQLTSPIGDTLTGLSNMATVASHTWPFMTYDGSQNRGQ